MPEIHDRVHVVVSEMLYVAGDHPAGFQTVVARLFRITASCVASGSLCARAVACDARFTHDGAAVISGGNDGRLVTWDLTRRARSAAELAAIVRRRVPRRLEGDVAVPRDLEFDDPTCKSLALDR